jgi:hypothetical protein
LFDLRSSQIDEDSLSGGAKDQSAVGEHEIALRLPLLQSASWIQKERPIIRQDLLVISEDGVDAL